MITKHGGSKDWTNWDPDCIKATEKTLNRRSVLLTGARFKWKTINSVVLCPYLLFCGACVRLHAHETVALVRVVCNLPLLNDRLLKRVLFTTHWWNWEWKEKAKQILVTLRNYCQPAWWGRASLLLRSNTFKCKWTLPTSITFKFNFTFCLGRLTSDNLSVYGEIRTVPHWGPFLSMCQVFFFSLSVAVCHAPLKWTNTTREPWFHGNIWLLKP